MAIKTARWYQAEAEEAVVRSLVSATGGNPVAAIVTAGGKSYIIARIIGRLLQYKPAARILVLQPDSRLTAQNHAEAEDYLGQPCGVYCAKLGLRQRACQVTFGTPQSVANQIRSFPAFDYILVDEAHEFTESLKAFGKILAHTRTVRPDVRLAGFTATPYRMEGAKVVPLTEYGTFTHLAIDVTSGRNYNRLTAEGYISQIVAPPVDFPAIDLSGLRSKGGEYDESQLAERAQAITAEAVAKALEAARGRRHIMWFAVNIAHADMIGRELEALGEQVAVIHGGRDSKEQDADLQAFRERNCRHVVSVDMLTTGFNAPFVDALVLLVAMQSQIRFRQIIGRGLRVCEGKTNCLALDAGGNFLRLGAINAPLVDQDSRAGLWSCSDDDDGSTLGYTVASFVADLPDDLRDVLGLEVSEACGYLNDPEHLFCRQCGRPRRALLKLRTAAAAPLDDEDDGNPAPLEKHTEQDVVQQDAECLQSVTVPVAGQRVGRAEGDCAVGIIFETEDGQEPRLYLDFDRDGDPAFFAMARRYYEIASGKRLPKATHRVLLMPGHFQQPESVTLTTYPDGSTYLTGALFIRDGKAHHFVYDPDF
jgi:superfamily II DNA or RNA helicase